VSKLKSTISGKAGKRRGQYIFSTVFMRGCVKGRVMTRTYQHLFDLILEGANDEQEGALAGKQIKKAILNNKLCDCAHGASANVDSSKIKMAAAR
jgi:hypothetical protein